MARPRAFALRIASVLPLVVVGCNGGQSPSATPAGAQVPSAEAPSATSAPSASSSAASTASSASSAPEVVTVARADVIAALGTDPPVRKVPDGAGAVRYFGIAPGSASARLGLENGDRIQSANDLPVDTPAAEAKALEAAKTASDMTLRIIRKGAPLTLKFHLQ